MCLGVPGRIVSIEGKVAIVDFWGVRRKVALDIVDEDVTIGDHVLVHVGFAIRRISPEDLAETLAFYERAFGLERKMILESGEYGELQTGDTTLAFTAQSAVNTLSDVPFEPAALHKVAPPIELGLVSDSVEADFERAVAAGAVVVKPPETRPWGKVAWVRDNNGFLVEIVSHTAG